MKMDPEVKAKWITALRSGEYGQAKNGLKRTFYDGTIGHCCLGVLSEIASEEGVCSPFEKDYNVSGVPSWFIFEGQRVFDSFQPDSVSEWAGLDSEDAGLLAEMNDEGSSFDEIAEHIQNNL